MLVMIGSSDGGDLQVLHVQMIFVLLDMIQTKRRWREKELPVENLNEDVGQLSHLTPTPSLTAAAIFRSLKRENPARCPWTQRGLLCIFSVDRTRTFGSMCRMSHAWTHRFNYSEIIFTRYKYMLRVCVCAWGHVRSNHRRRCMIEFHGWPPSAAWCGRSWRETFCGPWFCIRFSK